MQSNPENNPKERIFEISKKIILEGKYENRNRY